MSNEQAIWNLKRVLITGVQGVNPTLLAAGFAAQREELREAAIRATYR